MQRKLIIAMLLMLGTACAEAAAVAITGQRGWLESGFVTWQKAEGLKYNVYVSPASSESWTKLDDELVREYPDYGRADALGLKAGSYRFKVVPVSNNEEQTSDAAVSSAVEVKAHNREGFAHKQAGTMGIGAYNNDGTLKSNARVLYVWGANAKTVSLKVKKDEKGNEATYTGLQNIIYGYQKGNTNGSYDQRPLCVRIIGTIRDTDMDSFGSSAEGLQIKGAKDYQKMHITIEGVGNDATIWGFGFLLRNSASVELRNFGIMLCMDDCISIDTKNEMLWIHNLDFFYGKPGSDSDQKKGDGTLDIKGRSHWCTFSYNHFFDSGKASLGGMKSEATTDYNTYHHNWFDHSDSRHPRIRTMSMHIYNNYFDGNSKYGVGMTYGGSAFVEQNYFRHCKYPMLISRQGTDATGSGTFSGENGGVIKSFGNVVEDAARLVTYQQNAASWDCWEAGARDDKVPADVVAKAGGTGYNNFDTDADVMYDYTPDAASDIPAILTGDYGAGRMQHGDFQWTFDNATEDTNDAVIPGLKAAIEAYQSRWMGHFSGTTAIRNLSTAPAANQPIYDLRGRKVTQPRRAAVYIQNKRKSIYR